ncbi:MAG TPA: hypothetical protein ENN21_04330 [Spirochaetes bacterium]|nr:hypothetical protein [Spirochaetota bacterium]
MKLPDISRIKTSIAGALERGLDRKNQWLFNIIIIVLVNLVGLFLYFRVDLTRNNAYSLSKISKNTVKALESPLSVKVFFSSDLPAPYNSVYRYIADLMEEYAQYGGRKFRYEFIDVEKHKEMATDFGVHPVQVREIKNDRVSTRNAYMGLAMVHGDLIETVNSITEPQGVEYRVTTLIQKMTGKVDALQRLDRPIGVTLYASGSLPIQGMQDLHTRVETIVNRTARRNYDRLRFNHVNPDSEKRAMDLADMYGIPKLKWPAFTTMDGRRVNPGEGMIGIVVSHKDRFETLQILSRTILGQYTVAGLETLEERINGAVDNLISINPQIGYLTGHGERDLNDGREGAGALRELVGDMYELKPVDLTKEEIPSNLRTIIVNGPRAQFTDTELYKIDQFIMTGKSVLFFVDSFQEIQPGGQNMFMREPMVLPLSTGIEKLVAHYGITVNRDVVLDENSYRTTMRGLGEQNLYFAPLIDEDGLNRKNPVTKHLKRVVYLKSSSLGMTPEGGRDREVTPLVSSSDRSWLMKGRISYMPWTMSPPGGNQMASYTLTALLSGQVESYFAGKDMPVAAAEKGKISPVTSVEFLARSIKPVRIIVVGTSEITTPSVIEKEGRSPNSVLVHNMIDYLNGNADVPEMRSKGLELNPIKDRGEGFKLALKLVNIAGLPLLVVLAGMVFWKIRASRRKRVMAEFARGDANE